MGASLVDALFIIVDRDIHGYLWKFVRLRGQRSLKGRERTGSPSITAGKHVGEFFGQYPILVMKRYTSNARGLMFGGLWMKG